MRLASLSLLLCFLISLSSCQKETQKVVSRKKGQIALVPQVRQLKTTDLKPFIWDSNCIIYSPTEFQSEAKYVQKIFSRTLSEANTIKELKSYSEKKEGVYLSLEEGFSKEAYSLEIQGHQVLLKAGTGEGMMRGIQCLRQLMVPAFHGGEKREAWALPTLRIKDEPAFQHRGLLLDVCRHFFDIKVLKKYVDLLAFYRMNVLHLHLTEDQAWRMQTDAYPKLHQEAGYRTELNGERYGGYYTKDQLRELVAYAEERHITIIPEIELPGHAQAALSAYPEFSCLGEDASIEVANDWGVFKEIYCAGNEGTFAFLETILEEVLEIFPSEYIHIGGDEAPKFRWEHCAKCQARIHSEGLADEHELQSYFIKRIEGFLNSKGRQLIGWDEILEGGLSPNATVQSWRGMEGGISAARSKHGVIMSPTSHCYLDYGLERIDLQKIYSFDPIPEELSPEEAAFILGGECNMWTEHVPNEKNLDSKVSPRMQGLAEVLWTYPEERDFQDFYQRMQVHYPILEAFGVKYGPETLAASIYAEVYQDSGKVFVGAKRNLELLDMKVFFNEKEGPWGFDLKASGRLKAMAFKGEKPYGDTIEQEFVFHQALAKAMSYQNKYEKWYSAGGDIALVNGTRGSLNFRDGQWQGFSGVDMEVVIDLEERQPIKSVSSNFYHYNNAWIFRPDSYRVYYSDDAQNWQEMGSQSAALDPKERGQQIITLAVRKEITARYLKVVAENIEKVPDWHEAAGSEAWIFIDEIVVENGI